MKNPLTYQIMRIFPQKILKSRTFKKSSILIVKISVQNQADPDPYTVDTNQD
jgi:hypothetical protein